MREILPIIKELQTLNKQERKEFFAVSDTKRFFIWWVYYFFQNFKSDLADFHFDWIQTLTETDKSVMIEWFRWSIKTEIVKAYVTYCICNSIEKYIVVQSFDSSGSEDMVRNVARMLVSRSLTDDYGQLFPLSLEKEDLAKRSITNFDCTNGVKVVSRSLGEKLRGAVTFDEATWSSRPTLLILDDIDVIDSVRNKEVIDKNEQKIENETIWSMSKERSRIIFLGNTILSDWIVRRFAEKVQGNRYWTYFKQPLYTEMGKVAWDFFTPDTIDKIRAQEWEEAFKQNYLLIPSRGVWSRIFKGDYEKYAMKPIAVVGNWKVYGQPTDQIAFGVDVAGGGENGDYMAITGKKDGKTVLQFHGKVNELQLAREIDFILNWQVDGKKYVGNFLIENNVGRALINECLRYPWGSKILPYKNPNEEEWEEGGDDYGFRTTASSKMLLIKQYESWLSDWRVTMSEDVLREIETFVWDKRNRPNAQSGCHDDLIISEMLAIHATMHYALETYPVIKVEHVNDIYKNDIARAIEAKMREQAWWSDYESFEWEYQNMLE